LVLQAPSSDPQGPSHNNDLQSDPYTDEQLMNPSLRSGCTVHMQPVLSEPCFEENRLNRLNSQAQTVPVIADGQAKLYPSRAVRLFPTQTKCEDNAPLRGPPVTPQAWSGLSSFRVMGSFKKLRTSVFQGIQNRSNAMAAGQERNLSSMIEDGSSFLVTKRDIATSQIQETDKVSNGTTRTRKTSSVSDEEDCEEEVCGFQRNSHFSQSIRKAYGAGRISLLDLVKTESPTTTEPDPSSTVDSIVPCKNLETQENVNVLKRLSKSADNLHVFKGHFKRNVTSAEPQNPECPSTIILQRTTSSSSADLQEHDSGRRQSPLRTRGRLQKLVGSLTDLSVKSKNMPNPSPRVSLSPFSQLHDDYSRRTPCVPLSGRQRRPSPTPSNAQQTNTHHHIPKLHPAPSCPAVFSSTLNDSLEPPIKTTALISDYVQVAVSSTDLCLDAPVCPLEEYCEPMECHQNGINNHYSQMPKQCSSPSQKQTMVNGGNVNLECLWTEERETDDLEPVSRPPVPSHRVPPYRAMSARLRPCIFSQSTPIGLDRMGRHKVRRVLSDGSCDPMLDDSVSEEDGSCEELTEGTPYLQSEVDLFTLNQYIQSGHAVYAEALWDHVTMEEQELAFKAGDVIRVLDVREQDWWWGAVGDHEAWFPSSFVRVRVNQEDSSSDSVEIAPDADESVPSDAHKQNSQHRQQMRANVVKEIMDTERVYIKHLKDICEGYIRQCRKHPGMFTDAQLKTIFSNIEDIYRFQRKFLKDLEKKYNTENPHLSEIGSCFLQQEDGFSIYSEYCNTHPVACAELQRLMKQSRYKHFFEACRLLQQMIDISIAGFLLTPVQKICKYPLQLGELLKYTPKDHSDYTGVCAAHKAMKNVASLINERKRRLESIDTIAHWQVAILHWAGDDVLTRSSELIHSGELTRIVRPSKTQQRSYFLFDHQLVFCKKDVLRRDLLHYRGRMDTDLLEPIDLPDGRHAQLGLLKNAFLLRHAENLNVLCVLCCKKSQDKQRWLQAFARERRRVQEDQEMGMEITEAQRKQAVHNARKSKQGKMKKMNYSDHPLPPHHQPLHPLHQRHVTVPTSIPQQQVFSLAEPKKKPSHLLYSLARSALFRK
ncbi:hypothetical protein cypCar_00002823, partial [Cyprinus carpio]